MKKLLGIGGSDDSLRALEWTLDHAEDVDDELVVAVVDNPETDHDAEEVVEHAEETVEEYGADIDAKVVRLEHGRHPGSALVEYAEEGGYDEIVLAGGKKSAMGKIRLGKIVEFVLLNSHTTVRLVR